MNRSLRRRILRAYYATPCVDAPREWSQEATLQRHRHRVEVDITFPRGMFADAPRPWTPGEEYTEVLGGAWLRTNADGSQTAVVADVGPKTLPGRDGGPWTDEELWTVTSHDPSVFAYLDDKPHRITWALGRDDVTIIREPYAAHPHLAYADYWDAVHMQLHFTPRLDADGRYRLTLAAMPNSLASTENNVLTLAAAASHVLKTVGGTAVVRSTERNVDPGDWRNAPPEVDLAYALAPYSARF
ncbi:hypothetical protein ACWD3I_24900 [Streptomyces sp. NPDC002817]|uniref:hypothetical protein n=1 Tax=Streptomyces sp. NPDC088357 TaxID=3154655 RepID=UPI003422EAEB